MGAWNNAMQAAPIRGVVGRAASTSMFELDRWAPSGATARFVEHFWSVSWDLREQGPFDSTVITFPSLHLTHEWGDDGPRHGSQPREVYMCRAACDELRAPIWNAPRITCSTASIRALANPCPRQSSRTATPST